MLNINRKLNLSKGPTSSYQLSHNYKYDLSFNIALLFSFFFLGWQVISWYIHYVKRDYIRSLDMIRGRKPNTCSNESVEVQF